MLAALGVDVEEIGTLWEDEPETGPGRRKGHLQGRNDLLANLQEGNMVVVASAHCLGVGAADVEWFLAEVLARGATVTISHGTMHATSKAGAKKLLDAFKSAQNVSAVRKSRTRAKRRSRKPKTKPETQ